MSCILDTHATPAKRPYPGYLALLTLIMLLPGCASPGHAPREGSVFQRGNAAYYADSFAGRPTASGERFNPRALTAAHRTLALGSRVRVTNLDNDRHVTVRINDRGPFTRGRVIDLSPAAARRLKMINAGVAPVSLQLISSPR